MRIVVAYRGIPHAPGWATGDAMVRAFCALGHDARPYGNYYQSPRWMGNNTIAADLLVYMECCDADPQYAELAGLECPKVYWEFDTALHREATAVMLDHFQFDRVFMANATCAEEFGAQYLPYAADIDHFAPVCHDSDEVAIIGTPFHERVAFASRAGVDVISGIHADKYAARLAGLAVHVHHYDSGGDDMVVARPWETMASGVCLLAPETEAMKRHFTPGEHYVPYTGDNDCRAMVKFLLRDSKARKRIAQAGHTLVSRKHTYLCRARAILAAVNS